MITRKARDARDAHTHRAHENSLQGKELQTLLETAKSELKAESVQLRNAKFAMRARARAARSESEREAVSEAQSALHQMRCAAYLRHAAYCRLLQRRHCLRIRTSRRSLAMSQNNYWCSSCNSSYEDHYPKTEIQETKNEQR